MAARKVRKKARQPEKAEARQHFATNLRSVLDICGYTQQQLADLSGRSLPYVNKVLQAKENFSVDYAEAIAKAVELPVHVLLSSPAEFNGMLHEAE